MVDAPDLISELVTRPALRSRNEVGYMTVRSWRTDARKKQIAAFKAEKAKQDSELVPQAADEVAAFLRKFAPIDQAAVTCIPCGHSRRHDCFGKRLAIATANRIGLPFVQVWEDRFCKGVSHPKEFVKLPPLIMVRQPSQFMIVVDDVATSGWHLEEAVTALRAIDIPAMAVAWIGGQALEGGNSRQSETTGSADGDEDHSGSPFGNRGRVWRV